MSSASVLEDLPGARLAWRLIRSGIRIPREVPACVLERCIVGRVADLMNSPRELFPLEPA
jgi:hypothetical protein